MGNASKEDITSVSMEENQKHMIIIIVLKPLAAKTCHANKWHFLSGRAQISSQIKTTPRQYVLKTEFNAETETIFNSKMLKILAFKSKLQVFKKGRHVHTLLILLKVLHHFYWKICNKAQITKLMWHSLNSQIGEWIKLIMFPVLLTIPKIKVFLSNQI